ncbi:MAG: glycosyltransferase family 9 protein [Armatimonadetes bacterium]|nr:glycosyltransferase family 9 protein [Armatimonadota bacterium]
MKVLIVRFAAIGDCVMTTWPVTALREHLPEAHIVWAVQDRCAPVVDTDRLVSSLHVVPRDAWKRRRWSPAVWREQVLSYTALRRSGIDVGFDFQGHSKTALMLRLSGAKERFASRATDALAARLNPPVPCEGEHEVERGLSLVRHRFAVMAPLRTVMPEVATLLKRGYVSLQTGTGEPDKSYPAEKWRDVAHRLVSAGLRVVTTGSGSDPRLDVTGVEETVGTLGLRETLAVVAGSDVHLAGDTGTGHAAAAYGVPVVSLFGRTDPARFRPWTPKGDVLRPSRSVTDIAPDDVVEACLRLRKEGGAVARPC